MSVFESHRNCCCLFDQMAHKLTLLDVQEHRVNSTLKGDPNSSGPFPVCAELLTWSKQVGKSALGAEGAEG